MWPLGLSKKPDYIQQSNRQRQSPVQMVETNTSGIRGPGSGQSSPPSNSTISTGQTNSTYITTAMLLGTQGCGYLGQRIQNHLRERSELEQQQQQSSPPHHHHHQQHHAGHPHQTNNRNNIVSSMPTSLFTIDSILASNSKSNSEIKVKVENSPSNSPTPPSITNSPMRPTRVPAMLHPGLHLGHLAAAAASGFGTPSDFLGK